MTDLRTTHRTTVTEDQIDHLGHMNVRFYGVAARAGTDAMLGRLCPSGVGGFTLADVYTRHLNEQLLGASLEVRSGVLGGTDRSVELYHELRNVDTDQLAASFVHRVGAPDGTDGAWLDTASIGETIEIPERGRPRTVDLHTRPLASAPTLESARALGLAARETRSVTDDECLPDGSYRATDAPMLVWGGVPLDGETGPALHDGPDGQMIGWAAMENRVAISRLPRAGDRIQSFGAVIDIRDKTTHRILWAFDVDRAELLLAFEVVDLAFDTVSRKAVSIPEDLRAHAASKLQPGLAPASDLDR